MEKVANTETVKDRIAEIYPEYMETIRYVITEEPDAKDDKMVDFRRGKDEPTPGQREWANRASFGDPELAIVLGYIARASEILSKNRMISPMLVDMSDSDTDKGFNSIEQMWFIRTLRKELIKASDTAPIEGLEHVPSGLYYSDPEVEQV